MINSFAIVYEGENLKAWGYIKFLSTPESSIIETFNTEAEMLARITELGLEIPAE
jgi:hypothetical protein